MPVCTFSTCCRTPFARADRVKTMVHSYKSESHWAAVLAACSEQMGLTTHIGTLHRVARWKFGIFMYFEGDGAASIATHVSFVLYLTSVIIYFYCAKTEKFEFKDEDELQHARYLTGDSFRNGHISGALIQVKPDWVFYFNVVIQLLSVSRLLFWFLIVAYGYLRKGYFSFLYKREAKKNASALECATDEAIATAEAKMNYIRQKMTKLELLLSKSVGGLKTDARMMEVTNTALTVMVLIPLANWEAYKYLWVPTFLHIWHAKFFFLILLKDRMTGIEAKNDAMSYRTKVYVKNKSTL